MLRRLLMILAGLSIAVTVPGPSLASLFQPDDHSTAIPVGADGVGKALPFEEFAHRLQIRLNDANPLLKATERQQLLAQIKTRESSRSLNPDETAALAADLLRAGRIDDAMNRLKPLYDDRERKRTRTYFVCATLAHVHAAREEWAQASEYLLDLSDMQMPLQVKGLTAPQRAWQSELDRDYLTHYIRIHQHEADAKSKRLPAERTGFDANEDVLPLFPLPDRTKPRQPIRFVNDQGRYEPGVLSQTERAKLPPDARAVAQQLLLWFPHDTRLYWLLAELYAADGKFDEAKTILDQCTSESRKFGNHKVLMEHRAAVRAAFEAKREADDAKRIADEKSAEEKRITDEKAAVNKYPISLRTIGIYFGAVGVIAILAALRAFKRRSGRGCGTGQCG